MESITKPGNIAAEELDADKHEIVYWGGFYGTFEADCASRAVVLKEAAEYIFSGQPSGPTVLINNYIPAYITTGGQLVLERYLQSPDLSLAVWGAEHITQRMCGETHPTGFVREALQVSDEHLARWQSGLFTRKGETVSESSHAV